MFVSASPTLTRSQAASRGRIVRILAAAVFCVAASASHAQGPSRPWWGPGDGTRLPATIEYRNPHGSFGLLNAKGAQDTEGHPFFEPIGENGRACVTCHQPADAMSLSVETIQQRWEATHGTDPPFAAVDGKNCPDLPQGEPVSHSLLLGRGLFRVFLPWPPRTADDEPIEPEFDIEVVRDPTGCNTHPVFGLESSEPTISIYRQPRPAINLRYVTGSGFGVSLFVGKSGILAPVDPDTGLPLNMNMMADARDATLGIQAQHAAATHLELRRALAAEELDRIETFERQLYGAQIESVHAGRLDEPGGPPALRPEAMATGQDSVLGNNTTRFVFPFGEVWKDLPDGDDSRETDRNAFRESVARGHDVFFFRTFWIRDSMHINTVGLGNPIKRTLFDLSRHAHDGHGRRERLDRCGDHEPAVGERGTDQPLGDGSQ